VHVSRTPSCWLYFMRASVRVPLSLSMEVKKGKVEVLFEPVEIVWDPRLSYRCSMWSFEGPVALSYRFYFPMLVLVISFGRDRSVHTMLEFCAMKKNFRIVSDMERVFWTVWFRMNSLVFLFLTPSVSSLARDWIV